ncbi:hypothetical protein GFH48_06210 [Streptomyces fagopyri]|uniref:Secreted protein n=1 Tax=Streptomyces fagopyri TaxID=2662397 RepID=A0A5Q0L742_9ACTN|nr:hypothetical protein [Streptomyces fagopyri]QFZ72915.1 hypothetical protein GFH48_06210 [Streptomyces fagopyri]
MMHRNLSLLIAAGTAATTIALAGPASAAPAGGVLGPIGYSAVPAPGCSILEEVQVQTDGHEWMRWETNPTSPYCEVDLVDNGVTKATWTIKNNVHYTSAWYYDGPGHSEKICAISTIRTRPVSGCGPLN